jgi:hypothetical protein
VLAVVLVLIATVAGPAEPQVPVIEGGKPPEAVVAEGLTFYAEGDYERAAAWLTLVALPAPHLSASADIALADMYERGLGVTQDVRRAYALYLHAGTSTSDTYETQQLARAALTRLGRELSPDDQREATLMASRGFRDGLTSQALPLASGGVLDITPEHLAVSDGPTLHEEEWGDFSMSFERVSMHPPAVARPGRDFLEVLFWRTAVEDGSAARTLMWRVYAVEREGIHLGCETPLLVIRGLLVRLPDSLPADLRARARLVVPRTGPLACQPGQMPVK